MRSELRPAPRLTLGRLVDAGTRQLAAAGLPTPRRDAERIAADLLDSTPAGLVLDRDRILEPDQRSWLQAGFARRERGEPVQYVTATAGFRELTIRCDRRALIPRPETEGLVDRVLEIGRHGVVADVGTGSGCIGLSLRQEGLYRMVLGLDRSDGALALAAHNRHRLGLDLVLLRSDFCDALSAGSIDVLVANPPYVSSAEYARLPPGVRDYEPRLALESGVDGLEATARLLADGLRVVGAGGAIVLELASERAARSAAIATAVGWGDVRVDDDVFGRPRYLVARRERRR